MGVVVSSIANPVVKRMRLLSQRKHRKRHQATVVHGLQPVRQAAEAGADIESLIVAPSVLRSPSGQAFVEQQRAQRVKVVEVTAELMQRLSERDRPSGLSAIVRVGLDRPEDLVPRVGPCTIVALDQVAAPGNLGTIVRTVNATGADGVLLIGATADPFDPAAVKASMGAIFTVKVARLRSLEDLFTWGQRHGVAIAGTAARAASTMWDVTFPDRLALLLGSEGEGLSEDARARVDTEVAIPMVGTAESLNLAAATAVLLYEVWRSRGHENPRAPLSADEGGRTP